MSFSLVTSGSRGGAARSLSRMLSLLLLLWLQATGAAAADSRFDGDDDFYGGVSGGAGAGATAARSASLATVAVYVQPVRGAVAAAAPSLLAEIQYDAVLASSPAAGKQHAAQVVSFAVPEMRGDTETDAHTDSNADDAETDAHTDSDDALYRIGLFDPAAGRWLSSTSVLTAANFAKGFRPEFVLTVLPSALASGTPATPLAVSCRGVAIDAGATRDFGPQASVVVTGNGKMPVLNQPVVLSPEGRKVEPEPEKTFLQKYWWVIGIAVMMLATGGGDGK